MHKVEKKGIEITGEELVLPTTPEEIAQEEEKEQKRERLAEAREQREQIKKAFTKPEEED